MAAEPVVDLQGVEVDRRSARKDGREVVALRCVDTGMKGFVVECDVYPVDAVRVEPLRPGPYTFATRAQASRAVPAGGAPRRAKPGSAAA